MLLGVVDEPYPDFGSGKFCAAAEACRCVAESGVDTAAFVGAVQEVLHAVAHVVDGALSGVLALVVPLFSRARISPSGFVAVFTSGGAHVRGLCLVLGRQVVEGGAVMGCT
jgi:hypothetical protein